jgi:hypothetical protein
VCVCVCVCVRARARAHVFLKAALNFALFWRIVTLGSKILKIYASKECTFLKTR